ncbi:MAG: glutathione S-transferase N-terminal domain-containing protein [Methylotenera sp.]|nr:glutathione S-transferase N-terminal domain-containing protein [Methylotenera sp.]HPH07060.1 glutathione S-transferase N-terminal domain-containing protein [Methylotenera sp.]HPM49125.1 glutathione S-transferase N-terminal domain-containing protein [Methylotenera sp.]
MKLFYTVNSPYARKVRIVALEKRIQIGLLEVVLADPDCPVKQYNPLGKVPVLVLPDGESLYDSRVIVEYLDNRTPLAHLIPQDLTAKIKVRRWEALADGVCDAAVSVMLEQRKPEAQQSSAHIEKQFDKVTRGLNVLNLDLAKKKWCVNEKFSLADIALGCALGYLDLRVAHLNWQESYPNLAKHYSVLVKRASFKQTMPVA